VSDSEAFNLRPIGYVRSSLTDLDVAPMQGYEGAPAAWVELETSFEPGLLRLSVGDDVILITWFHLADRSVMQLHPRDDLSLPLTGVFGTRSPDRPNPLGLHRVTIRLVEGSRLLVGPLEAIDGTPVVDIKPVLERSADD
jgi:tRNA-Thr(GGU) m(6)t(6)A37 methyltransferase TsaA